ncbi:MAG: Contractile injection system tape measure protein, partial [Bacteroidota bacterium]
MTHFIQKIIYDINIPSEAQSNWLWEEISRLQQYELEAIIETTLDAFSLPNKTIRLEQLELDLGDIQAEDLKNDLPKLLANTLRKALEKQLSQSAEEIEEIKKQHFKGYDSPEANEIQAIVYFLQQGILPETLKVQLEEGEVLDINTLFQKQLTENTTKFLQQLQPLRADQDALRRLTTQFSETSYTLLIEKLAVEKQDFIQTTEQRLIALLSAQFQGKSITQQEIVAMVRQQILRILLGNLNGSFEEATFLEALFEGLQNAYNSEPLDFILHKNQVFLLQNKENNRFEVLQEQGFTIDANLISSNDVLEKTLQTPILQLFDNITQGLDFIQYVLLHHQTPWWAARLVITDLDTLILEIHKADKPKLEQMLKMVFSSSYLDKKTTIDSLVQRLPSSTIDLLLQTIEPDRYGFIQTVVLAVTRWAERRGVAISGYTDAQKGAQAAIIDYVASKKSNDFSIQNLVSHTLIVLSEAAKTSVAVEEKWFSEIVQAAV